MRSARTLSVLVFCLNVAGLAYGQVGEQGSLTGTVTDPQAGVLPGVMVTALNATTNVTRTSVTTASGVYLVTGLSPGTYKVTYTIASFRPVAREVEVRTGEHLRIDIKLDLGALTDEVLVTAETPLLNTTTASRATIISTDKVADSPLNGRNPYMFVFAAPGVPGDSSRPSISYRPFDNGGMDSFNVNGGVGHEPLPARRRAQHEQRGRRQRQPRVRPVTGRGTGSARGHEHLRRAVRTDGRRDGQRERQERHQQVLRHRVVRAPRQEPESESLPEHRQPHPGAVQWPAPTIPTTGTITNFSTFGTVASTQSNDPRFIMLTVKLLF